MGRSTRKQQEESRRRARARCELIDGLWIATGRPPEEHGTPTVASYDGCQCVPCRASVVRNVPERRAARRREHLARRVLVEGRWVAAHLPDRKHGTPTASDYYGCQCTVCVAAARRRRGRT